MEKYQISLGYTINSFEDNQTHYLILQKNLQKYSVNLSDNYTDSIINNKISHRTIYIRSVLLQDIVNILNDIPIEYILIDIIVYPIRFRLITTLYSYNNNIISKDLTNAQLEITKIASNNAEDRNKYYYENVKNKRITLNQIDELKKLLIEKDLQLQEKEQIIQNYRQSL
jgi:hypothetical protein